MTPNHVIIDLFFPKSRETIEAYLKMVETYTEVQHVIEEQQADPLTALAAIRNGLLNNPLNPETEGVVTKMRGPYVRARAVSTKSEEIIAFARRKKAQAKMPASLYQNMLMAPSIVSAKGMYDRAVRNGLAQPYYQAKKITDQSKNTETPTIEIEKIEPVKLRHKSRAVIDYVKDRHKNYVAPETAWNEILQESKVTKATQCFMRLKAAGQIMNRSTFRARQRKAEQVATTNSQPLSQ